MDSNAHHRVLKSRIVDCARELPEDSAVLSEAIKQAAYLRISRRDQRHLAKLLNQGKVRKRKLVQGTLAVISYHILTTYCAKGQPELKVEWSGGKKRIHHKYYLPQKKIHLTGWLKRTSAKMLVKDPDDLLRACIPPLKDWKKIIRFASHLRVDRRHQRDLEKRLNDLGYQNKLMINATIGVIAAHVYGNLGNGFVPNIIPSLEKIQTKLSSKRKNKLLRATGRFRGKRAEG